MAVSFPLLGGALSGGSSLGVSSRDTAIQNVSTNIQNSAESRQIERSLSDDAVTSSLSSSGFTAASVENSTKISALTEAEGALAAIEDTLSQIEDLATQASETSSSETQAALNEEKDALIARLNEIESTQFNGQSLLSGELASELGIPEVNIATSLSELDLTNQENSTSALTEIVSAASSTRELGNAVSNAKASVAADIESEAIERNARGSEDLITTPEQADKVVQEVTQQIKKVAETEGPESVVVNSLLEEDVERLLN